MKSVSTDMKRVSIPAAGGEFRLADAKIPDPGPGEVRVKVAACGVCHSDVMVKEGQWPNLKYPRVPGHEVAGVIDVMAPDVRGWAVGDRVGVGWHGYQCGYCDRCRVGDFMTCVNEKVTGFDFDGGYEQYMTVSSTALARIPEALKFSEAAPLMCAGVTTFNSLRHARAMPGDLVAVLGIGGLGHLAVQFARQSGYRVAAIGHGKDKEELARHLGAHIYIDGAAGDPAAELQRLGGARVVVDTAPDSSAMAQLVGGLGPDGMMLALGVATDPLPMAPGQLIGKRQSIPGWPAGTAKDSEDTLNFCALTGVRPMIEEFALADTAKAYERMITGKVRFRAVLVN
jgi:D-arabinose 1-dehydrogenase-like Zn-dependent alcohol dehydrogenase